jgi:hypothetical protein
MLTLLALEGRREKEVACTVSPGDIIKQQGRVSEFCHQNALVRWDIL